MYLMVLFRFRKLSFEKYDCKEIGRIDQNRPFLLTTNLYLNNSFR